MCCYKKLLYDLHDIQVLSVLISESTVLYYTTVNRHTSTYCLPHLSNSTQVLDTTVHLRAG